MKYVPKEITEEVNVTPINPLVNFGYLVGTVALGGLFIYVLLGMSASLLAKRIGPETEEKIGASLAASLPFEVIENDERVAYLEDLVASLQSDLEQTAAGVAQYPPVKVGILDTPVENAMVMAGSYLFVTDGLLAEVNSENELAFVIAHELGHLHHKDPLSALGRSLVLVTISGLLGIGQQVPSIVPGALQLAELGHSRGQESAADDYAIELIQVRYEHGAHSLDFFRRMQTSEPDFGALSSVAEWQQTHPLSSARIERIENTFERNGWSLEGEVTPLPENIDCRSFQYCD